MDYVDTCNIRIIGDSTVGKTSILYRFVNNSFPNFYTATVGFDYYSKDETINDKKIRIKIWDTAGQERYRSLTASFFRNSQGIILCYDVTNLNSFHNLKFWIESIKNSLGDILSIQLIILGNKLDLKHKREIQYEEADKFCLAYNLPYFECSAKEDKNIRRSFLFLVEKILSEKLNEDVLTRDSFNIKVGKKENTTHCC